ncbi:MAG TPA: plastocyanin/azurin family copper-binding protein [Chloroflexota bacterium]
MKLSMGRLGLVLLATGLLTIGASAVGVAYAQTAATVVMTEFQFNPANMVVSAGASRWTLQNGGQFPHNVHIEGNGVSMDVKTDGPVASGQNFTGTVNLQPGRYDVWCPVGMHRQNGMVGVLTVAGAAAGGAAQVPGALPRTGDADSILPFGAAGLLVGLSLLGAGVLIRRRAA